MSGRKEARKDVLIKELVEALIATGDALEHTDYLLGGNYNQVQGIRGALQRASSTLTKAKEYLK